MARKRRCWKMTEGMYKKLADEMIEWMREDGNYFLKGFANKKGFVPSNLDNYAKKNNYFNEAYKKAIAIQEEKLIALGMKNPVMPIFLLKNLHGYRDSHNLEMTGDIKVNLRRKPEKGAE